MAGRIIRNRAVDRRPQWSSGRDNAAHKRFERAVKKRDRHRCRWCGSSEDLRACHFPPLHQGGDYDPAHGVTLCGPCDRRTDPYAR